MDYIKEAYRILWEYLKRSELYWDYCEWRFHWGKTNQTELEAFSLEDIIEQLPLRFISEFEASGKHFDELQRYRVPHMVYNVYRVFGDIHRTDFELWWMGFANHMGRLSQKPAYLYAYRDLNPPFLHAQLGGRDLNRLDLSKVLHNPGMGIFVVDLNQDTETILSSMGKVIAAAKRDLPGLKSFLEWNDKCHRILTIKLKGKNAKDRLDNLKRDLQIYDAVFLANEATAGSFWPYVVQTIGGRSDKDALLTGKGWESVRRNFRRHRWAAEKRIDRIVSELKFP